MKPCTSTSSRDVILYFALRFSSAVMSTWKCQTCNFINSSINASCEMCDIKRPQGMHMQNISSTVMSTWKCQRCNYSNSSTAVSCGMCQLKRPQIHMQNKPQKEIFPKYVAFSFLVYAFDAPCCHKLQIDPKRGYFIKQVINYKSMAKLYRIQNHMAGMWYMEQKKWIMVNIHGPLKSPKPHII